ncbi:hypothetical protein ACLKA7_011548 [Drosophila subpalustris]
MDFASTSEEVRRLEDQKWAERRAHWGTSSTLPQNPTNTEYWTNIDRNPVRDYIAVAKQVRKWSFKLDGSSKLLEFLEQVQWSAGPKPSTTSDARASEGHSSKMVHSKQRALEDVGIFRGQFPGILSNLGLFFEAFFNSIKN